MIKKDILIQSILDYKETYGHWPTRKEARKKHPILYPKRQYTDTFGSWTKALEVCGYNKEEDITGNIRTREKKKRVSYYELRSCRNCKVSFVRKHGAFYCSEDCKNLYYSNECKECGNLTQTRSGLCSYHCRAKYDMKATKISEVSLYSEQNRYRGIRDKAHNFYKNHPDKESCQNCGYSKHTEVCHIHPISEFSLDSTLWDVNNINNIFFLCPNCHWELDYGDLTEEEIRNSILQQS